MNEENSASVHGVPGERARAAGVMRAIGPLLAAIFLCGLFLGALLPRVPSVAAGLGFLAVAGFLIWAVKDGMKGIDSFFKGARGEEVVAGLLAGLPSGYHVFHDVRCGRGIDHVVAGPNGVFVIETKWWSGSVTLEEGVIRVNGALPSRSPIAQVRASTRALASFLAEKLEAEPAVTGVVCFVGNTFVPRRVAGDGMVICNASEVVPFIVAHAGHLSSKEIERIVKVMERKE